MKLLGDMKRQSSSTECSNTDETIFDYLINTELYPYQFCALHDNGGSVGKSACFL
jgi:hypothetical protein